MKRFFIIIGIALMLFKPMWCIEHMCQSLVGKTAPFFNAQAVVEDKVIPFSFGFGQEYKDKYKVLVFYPSDFSFVCPTELRAIQEHLEEFNDRNAVVFAISVDQVYTHQAWLKTTQDKGGVQGITYPLVSDVTHEISKKYGVFDASGVAQRALFIVDKNNTVQSVMINNKELGRNIEEVLRLLDAIALNEQSGDFCPASWHKRFNEPLPIPTKTRKNI